MKIAIISLLAYVQATTEYDYIVVGSGPGGGTVATELALKKFKVLLIEAGPDHFKANESTPIFHARASEDPAIAFEFDVNHYDNDKKYFYPRAGVLGGCSVHNTQISVYPSTKDFNYMKSITGDDEWTESKMRNYFVRMERNQYPGIFLPKSNERLTTNEDENHSELEAESKPRLSSLEMMSSEATSEFFHPLRGHGYNGWFPTSYINLLRQLKIDDKLLDVAQAFLGNPIIDINGYDHGSKLNTDREARFFIPESIDKNKYTRFNFPKYIKEVAEQGYLTVMTDTFVTKILINDNNEAYGVEYRDGSYLYRASPLGDDQTRRAAPTGEILAKREVIVSGGTFNTPQLLMLSGIGDQDHLNSFNIPVKQHLPGVGRNLMDRYEITIVNQFSKKYLLLKDCLFIPSMEDPCYKEYIETHSGPYTSNGLLSGELKKSSPNLKEPNLFLLLVLSHFEGYYHGYTDTIANGGDTFSRFILKARTNNTNGYVKLLSSDPLDVPHINFQYFSDGDSDLNIMIEEFKNQREYIKNHIKLKTKEIFPGPTVQTDDNIRQFIKDKAWGHHACCTARMGKSDDPNAVLTPKFQVRGITNLRVVDASAIPRIPGYFPAILIHMMAMKAADDISAGIQPL